MTIAWIFHAAFADDDTSVSSASRVSGVGQTAPVSHIAERTADPVVTQIRAGDEQAFDTLYRDLYAPLVGFALHQGITRAVAEELVQDTFLSIWRARDQWDVRGTIREYLFGAVRNRVLDQRRHEQVKRHARERGDASEVAGVARVAAPPDTLASDAELRDAIDACLAAMPAERRQVLVLRWQHGLSYPEIATILGIGVNAAKQQGSRAQRALRGLLERFRR